MHWFAKKTSKTLKSKPKVKAVYNPMIKHSRSKTMAKPKPRPMTKKSVQWTQLNSQLQKMKNATNRLQNKEDMRRFIENGIPQPRVQQKNKV